MKGLGEVVRRALDHPPQLVTRGRRGEDAVVAIARSDYERLVAPTNPVDFLRDAPSSQPCRSTGTSSPVPTSPRTTAASRPSPRSYARFTGEPRNAAR